MSQMTKCIETVVLIGVAGAIIFLDKEMFFSTEHLRSKGRNPLDMRSVSILTEPSTSRNVDVLIQKQTELGKGMS